MLSLTGHFQFAASGAWFGFEEVLSLFPVLCTHPYSTPRIVRRWAIQTPKQAPNRNRKYPRASTRFGQMVSFRLQKIRGIVLERPFPQAAAPTVCPGAVEC